MFDPEKYYFLRDAQLERIAPHATLAQWRMSGKGPAYFKIGRRVAYLGRDLNEWLATKRVPTREQPEAA